MTTDQIIQIPKLAKTMRAQEIAERFGTTKDTVYRYARILREKYGRDIEFLKGKPGVKPKL